MFSVTAALQSLGGSLGASTGSAAQVELAAGGAAARTVRAARPTALLACWNANLIPLLAHIHMSSLALESTARHAACRGGWALPPLAALGGSGLVPRWAARLPDHLIHALPVLPAA